MTEGLLNQKTSCGNGALEDPLVTVPWMFYNFLVQLLIWWSNQMCQGSHPASSNPTAWEAEMAVITIPLHFSLILKQDEIHACNISSVTAQTALPFWSPSLRH